MLRLTDRHVDISSHVPGSRTVFPPLGCFFSFFFCGCFLFFLFFFFSLPSRGTQVSTPQNFLNDRIAPSPLWPLQEIVLSFPSTEVSIVFFFCFFSSVFPSFECLRCPRSSSEASDGPPVLPLSWDSIGFREVSFLIFFSEPHAFLPYIGLWSHVQPLLFLNTFKY